MKYLIFVLILFLSCSFSNDELNEIKYIIKDVTKNIEYQSDNEIGYAEYWKFSEETKRDKKGDCEDFVILCIDEIYKKTGIKCNMDLIHGHALLNYNGFQFEVQTGEIVNKYTIENIMFDSLPSEILKRRIKL